MYHITVQRAAKGSSIPTSAVLKKWAKAALEKKISSAELTIRIVDKDEMQTLNATYRKKDKPTNVLSFPFDMPKDIMLDEIVMLGDIVICADVIKEEALEQRKTLQAHWSHMIVHGILHLLGYDHENDADAEKMEAEEIKVLDEMGFSNPYEVNEKGE